MVSWMGRAALEIVGQSGLGHSFDPLVADTKDEYTEAVKSFMYVSIPFGYYPVFHGLQLTLGITARHSSSWSICGSFSRSSTISGPLGSVGGWSTSLL